MFDDLRETLRTAVADYMYSEGCTCCEDFATHRKHKERLAHLLDVPAHEDGSGFDFTQFRSKE